MATDDSQYARSVYRSLRRRGVSAKMSRIPSPYMGIPDAKTVYVSGRDFNKARKNVGGPVWQSDLKPWPDQMHRYSTASDDWLMRGQRTEKQIQRSRRTRLSKRRKRLTKYSKKSLIDKILAGKGL